MKILCIFTLASLVASKDILDCIKDSSRIGIQSKITGPNACEVRPHSKPWIINLNPCGGTLIANNIVLTAQHCHPMKGNYVVLGDHDKDDFDEGEQKIKIKEVFENPPDCPTCDFALLVLEKEVKTDQHVQIAKLPSTDEQCPTGKDLIGCGWGQDYFQKRKEDKLWCVAQKCLELSQCPMLPMHFPEEYGFCAGDPEDLRNGLCNKDSGGPLTYTDENGITTLYGVVTGMGMPGKFCNGTTIFSRVSHPNVLKWIKSYINEYSG